MDKVQNDHINIQIMENEKSAHDWVLNNLAWELYWWVAFFNLAFFKGQPVPVPVISFERTNVNNLGHYVIGRNAFGVKENININSVNLKRPLWDILATLLHEMAHSWQATHGKPSNNWFHNKEFQLKMLEFGILIDNRGCHMGVGDPFMFILRKHAVDIKQSIDPKEFIKEGFVKIPPKPKPKGKSKLKKWTCGCTNVRVGIKDLEAQCLKCSNKFELSS